MRHADIRRELRALVPDLTAAEWDWLVAKHYVSEVERGESTIDHLLREVRELPQRRTAPPPAAGAAPAMLETRKPTPAADDGPTAKRWRAVSRLLAREAAKEPDVQSFRAEVLAGQLLAPNDVDAWVRRQAAADGPAGSYLDGVPIPPGAELKGGDGRWWTDPPIVIDESAPLDSFAVRVPWLNYGTPEDRWLRTVATAHKGVLERLRTLSEELAERYRWESSQATLFVLTGLTPEVSPVSVGVEWRGVDATTRIVLTIDPALIPREVTAAYRGARDRIIEARTRPISDKHLELAVFGSDRAAGETWADRMHRWNADHPAWAYRRAANFARDVQRAEQRLAHPRYFTRGPGGDNG